jgi:hypothetical protein
MKENIRADRDQRLAHIIQIVREHGPLSVGELTRKLGIRARSRKISYDVETLTRLGLLEVQGGRIFPATRKFSKEDYGLALIHCRKLLRFQGYGQSVYDEDPFFKGAALIYQLVKTQRKDETRAKDFVQEFLRQIEHGKQVSEDKAFEAFLKLPFEQEVSEHFRTGYFPEVWQCLEGGKLLEAWRQLTFVVQLVSHGTPLKGTCRLCPSNYVHIKDSE